LLHSDADFVRNLEQTEQVLGLAAAPKFFRPPGGVARPNQLRLAQAHGYECMLGSAYAHDPMHPPVWSIRPPTNSRRRPPQGPPVRLNRHPESSREPITHNLSRRGLAQPCPRQASPASFLFLRFKCAQKGFDRADIVRDVR
jgi:hypothetical protein